MVMNFKMPEIVMVINFKMPEIVMVINFKMPTSVGILKFMTMTNDIACFCEQENGLTCLYKMVIYFKKITSFILKSVKHEKSFINLGPHDLG